MNKVDWWVKLILMTDIADSRVASRLKMKSVSKMTKENKTKTEWFEVQFHFSFCGLFKMRIGEKWTSLYINGSKIATFTPFGCFISIKYPFYPYFTMENMSKGQNQYISSVSFLPLPRWLVPCTSVKWDLDRTNYLHAIWVFSSI